MFCPAGTGDSCGVTEAKREGRSGAHGIHIGFVIPGVHGRGGMCHISWKFLPEHRKVSRRQNQSLLRPVPEVLGTQNPTCWVFEKKASQYRP